MYKLALPGYAHVLLQPIARKPEDQANVKVTISKQFQIFICKFSPAKTVTEYRRSIHCHTVEYQDLNVLVFCVIGMDVMWYHRLLFPLEFERVISLVHLSPAACFDRQIG